MNIDIKLHCEAQASAELYQMISNQYIKEDLTFFESVGKELKSIHWIRPKLFLEVMEKVGDDPGGDAGEDSENNYTENASVR